MAELTGIEWTDATWNPWMGCDRVSPGCAHCYMFTEQERYKQDPSVVRRSKTKFADPLRWKEPRRVFTCSWSDWFHEGADAWRDEAWDIIRRSPHLTFQILTKRAERIEDHLPPDWGAGYPNVWLGVSVENQRWVSRALALTRIPAVVRFLSCEPLLGPLDLLDDLEHLDWVIVGGESGPNARVMHEIWARDIQTQCQLTGTAFFLKQLGGFPDKRGHEKATIDGVRYVEMPRV